jgi:hypothetical protein
MALFDSNARAKISFFEGRNEVRDDALCLEREADFVFQVVIPTHRFLFRSVSVHDGFVMDAVFADRVFGSLSHRLASRIRRTEVRAVRIRTIIVSLVR